MRSIKSIISLLLIIAVLTFSIQNIAAVEIQFLLWSFSIPRALLIMILLGVGFVIGMLFYSIAFRRRRHY
jgi:putative membrane protein